MVRSVAAVALAFAIVAIAATARTAAAEPTRKITIDTEPEGATVYLNDKEGPPACAPTPCEVTAPLGETPMIIEREGYALDVQFEGQAEAAIRVDGKAKGNAPAQIILDPGSHHVIVTAAGKTVLDQTVEIELGQTAQLKVTIPEPLPGPPPPTEKIEDPLSAQPTEVKASTPGPQRPPIVIISAILDVGFRQFTYDNPHANSAGTFNVGNDSEGGQLMAGPLVQFFPMRALGVGALKNLSLVGRIEFGFNDQTVEDAAITDGKPLTSFWQAIELTARNRWVVGDTLALEVLAGYTRDRFEFNGDMTDIGFVPDADYQSVELGGRAALLGDTLEPYIELANRIVLSGGDEGGRFDQTSANGLHAALGLALHTGKLSARLEGQITRYSWTFSTNGQENPPYEATGATDQIELISVILGYAY
jgi:hypothetical protein